MSRTLRSAAAGLAPALLLAACTAGAVPGTPGLSVTEASGAPPTAQPSAAPTAPPSASAEPGSSGSAALPSLPGPTATASSAAPSRSPGRSPGSAGGSPGGTPIPVPTGPGGSTGPVQLAPPTAVTPVANLLDVRDVRAEAFTVAASGSMVRVTITWWSGRAPCSELSSVLVDHSGSATATLTVREGAQQLGIACPAIATYKQTTVDLGALAAGVWTIAVTGVDQPQTVRVGA